MTDAPEPRRRKRKSLTAGEKEVCDVVLTELRRAFRQRGPVTLQFVLDPWLPKGCRGVTILASVDRSAREYQIDEVRHV